MNIKNRIYLSILLLFLIAAGMFTATWIISSSQETDGLCINLAGRQRMLLQKMTKELWELELARSSVSGDSKLIEPAAITKAVRASIQVFEQTHTALAKGGPAPTTLDPSGATAELPPASAKAANLLGQVSALWQPFKSDAETALAKSDTATMAKVQSANSGLAKALNLVVDQMQEEARGKVSTLLATQAASVLLALGFALLVLYNLRFQVIEPIEALRTFAHKIAGGDFAAEVSGRFSHELLALKEDTAAMVSHLRRSMDESRARSEEAQKATSEAQAALDEAKAQEAKVQGLLTSISEAAVRAGDISRKVFAAIEELTSQVDLVNSGVEVQRDRMTETATAMEEMNATVLEVAQNAGDAAASAGRSKENATTGASGVRRAVDSIRHIEERILKLKETMARLGQEADNIGRIITVITDIADQTNLLALNAAIEAARAGDAGRGFAVVADEVRKLAEKTMQATREVGDAIGNIQSHAKENVAAVEAAAQDIVASTEAATESGQFMEEIVRIVDETAGQVQSIAAASEEQSAASEEINRAVAEVTRVAGETAEGMSRSASALMEVHSLVEELDAMIQGMAGARHGSDATGTLSGKGEVFIPWSQSLSVGIGSIDEQHKVLVGLINELHSAMRERRGNAVLNDVLGRLKDYTVKHFKYEEKLFAQHRYPDAESHAQVHSKLVEKVLDFAEDIRTGRATVSMDLLRFLKSWLTDHIMGTDKKYSPFLTARGVR
jgi:methyl-accepting chemotaxis protein/hemerythrin